MIQPHQKFEKEIWNLDGLVAGVDEVGKGCLAGPVVAAAVIFPKNTKKHPKIRDSKSMTPKMRAEMFEYIMDTCVDFGVGLVAASEIDTDGINPCTIRAMRLAIEQIKRETELVLVDAVEIVDLTLPQKAIIKGDVHVFSIAAASIVAKVIRDAIVSGFDNDYPGYGFSSHKGYGVSAHVEKIKELGFTPEHRKTFCTRIV